MAAIAKQAGEVRQRGRPKKEARPELALALHAPPECRAGDHLACSQGPEGGDAEPAPSGAWLEGAFDKRALVELARVKAGTHGLDRPATRAGFATLPADAHALAASALLGAREDRNSGIASVAKFCLDSDAFVMCSTTALAAMLGVARNPLRTLTIRLGAAISVLCRARQYRLEYVLATRLPRRYLIHCIEVVQYDETPLPVKVVGDPASGGAPRTLCDESRESDALAVPSASVCVLGSSGALRVSATKAAQKLVQTRQDVAMVIRVGGTMASICFRPHVPLSVVDRCTGECMCTQQLAVSQVTAGARAFAGFSRVVTTDAAAPNFVCERLIHERRSCASADFMHATCDLHGSANVYSKTFHLMEKEISGVVRTALALRTGSAMSRLRMCLRRSSRAPRR